MLRGDLEINLRVSFRIAFLFQPFLCSVNPIGRQEESIRRQDWLEDKRAVLPRTPIVRSRNTGTLKTPKPTHTHKHTHTHASPTHTHAPPTHKNTDTHAPAHAVARGPHTLPPQHLGPAPFEHLRKHTQERRGVDSCFPWTNRHNIKKRVTQAPLVTHIHTHAHKQIRQIFVQRGL